MQAFVDLIFDHLVLGTLVLTRLGMLLMAMPAIGVGVPKRIRALLALVLTALLMPTLAAQCDHPSMPTIENLPELAVAIGREALIGMLIGATTQMVITGLQLAGEAITSTGGMQLGDSVDPTTSSSMPALARMVGMMVTTVMLITGAHRLVLRLLVESFQHVPPGNVEFTDSMMEAVIVVMGNSMASGIRVAGPVIAALLLSNLVTGLISRTLPQINVLAIGLSINALAMLVVTALTIGSVAWMFQDDLTANVERLSSIWTTPDV
ncbi:MAG: flagellar biosynthetic protein FliR [Rhodopirellula sp. JB055]|uniref:flagellar biosynthetic protein FliR n=1 Tax=Rhodopirellula sp. JB055 TaxID=3342846 RepID=UPI00370B67DA